MSRRSDYRDRMTLSQFTDEEIELLIRGEGRNPELSSLAPFLTVLREEAEFVPAPGEVERAAIRAAAIVRSQLLSSRPASLSILRPSSAWRKLSERATLVLGSLVTLALMSGVGLAADASAPGDFLYGIDLALEEVGIGDGSIDERLVEAGVLVEKEDLAGAVELLANAISQADPSSDPVALAAAIEALEEMSSDLEESPPASSDAQEKVSDLLDFIDANSGKGTGLDGKDFGQGVADTAKGSEDEGDTGSEPDAPGNSENSNAGGNGNGNGNAGSGDPPGNSGSSNAGGNGKSNGNGKP